MRYFTTLTESERRLLATVLSGLNSALLIDETGMIQMCTGSFLRLAGRDIDYIEDHPVDEVFPGNRMMEVLQSGKALISEPWQLGGTTHYVSLVPLQANGIRIGVLAYDLFRSRSEAEAFASRVQKLAVQTGSRDSGKRMDQAKYSLDSIIGESEGIREARERVKIIANSNVPVLIQGDTGTGKELIAHAIHQESTRRDGPFVRVNCAGIPENLLESELFGYDDGAFTGARKGGKPGKFELASHGSIFLDEISELSLAAQAKLLRALQENEIERVGSTRLIPIDTRVISATNQPLTRLVEEGKFRKDLMFRLAVFNIYVPPLKEHPEDIPVLSQHFIEQYNRENSTKITGINDEGMEFLTTYHWPGNVRELMIAIERACLNTREGMLSLNDILRYIGVGKGQYLKNYSYPGFNLKEARQDMEKVLIQRALVAAEGNRPKAAQLLGISRSALYKKFEELGIKN